MLDPIAWHYKNSAGERQPVGLKQANGWGLHDMLGNVLEWMHDRHQLDLGSASAIDPVGLATGPFRVMRGGSFEDAPDCLRSAYRAEGSGSFVHVGLRCVRTADPWWAARVRVIPYGFLVHMLFSKKQYSRTRHRTDWAQSSSDPGWQRPSTRVQAPLSAQTSEPLQLSVDMALHWFGSTKVQ